MPAVHCAPAAATRCSCRASPVTRAAIAFAIVTFPTRRRVKGPGDTAHTVNGRDSAEGGEEGAPAGSQRRRGGRATGRQARAGSCKG